VAFSSPERCAACSATPSGTAPRSLDAMDLDRPDAERAQRLGDLVGVADHDDGEAVAAQVDARDAVDVVGRDGGERGAIVLEIGVRQVEEDDGADAGGERL